VWKVAEELHEFEWLLRDEDDYVVVLIDIEIGESLVLDDI
jgi:hypothetical protein